MRILKNQYDLLKDELKESQKKTESLERDHIAQVNKVYDKPLSEHGMDLQGFIITGFEITKLASMIYGVSKRKGEGFGYHQKPFNPMIKTLIKPFDPSSSSSAKKGLYSQFMPAANVKVLN